MFELDHMGGGKKTRYKGERISRRVSNSKDLSFQGKIMFFFFFTMT